MWDQYNRQRLPYYYCCFDFDRTTFEMTPDPNWVNSTGYLRAMMEGFVERLYPYTGDARTLEFLEDFVDYELAHGMTPSRVMRGRGAVSLGESGRREVRGMEQARRRFC